MLRFAVVAGLFACGGGTPNPSVVDAPAPDVPPEYLGTCPGEGRDKIKFALPTSCGNDGSVEWCIPDGDAQLMATLTAISPTITCAAGGGRARCHEPPGRLLCFYPTAYPDQCYSNWGEMKPEVWDDMCAIAALPQITEIVATILE